MEPTPQTPSPRKQRRRWLVLSILCFALAAYSVAGALWGTTENSWLTHADQLLWIALPFGVLGALFITLHVLTKRRQA